MILALWLLAAFALPLFPMGWLFNRVLASLPVGWPQALAVLLIPQLGVAALRATHEGWDLPSQWAFYGALWVLLSALFYAFRALSARELGIWTRLLASSGLALTWLDWGSGATWPATEVFVLSWSLPAALLLLLAGALTRRLGGAYLGLQGGLVAVLPRLTASLTMCALALLATPLFPGFFALLRAFDRLPLAFVPLLMPLPLLWGWAAGRFFQDLLFGAYRGEPVTDLGRGPALLIGIALAAFLFVSLLGSGVGL